MKKQQKIEAFILCFIVAITILMFYLHHQLPDKDIDRTKFYPRTSLDKIALRHRNSKPLETTGQNSKRLETTGQDSKLLETTGQNSKPLETTGQNSKDKYVILEVKRNGLGGWGNRIEFIIRAFRFAKQTKRNLIIDWPEFNDFFQPRWPKPFCQTRRKINCADVFDGDEQCLIIESKSGCGLGLPKKYNSGDFKKDMPDMGLFFKPKQKYQTILDNIDSHLMCFQLRTGGSLGFKGDFVYSEAPRAQCVYKYIIEKANEFDKDAVLFTDAKDLSTSFLQDAKRAVKLPYTVEHIDRNHQFSGFERVAIEISIISKCDYIFYHKGSSFIRNSLFLAKETAKITDTAKWQDEICTKRTEQLNIANNSSQETAIRNPNNPQGGWLSIVTRCPHHETNAARLVEIWSTLEHNTQHPERPVVHMLCTEMEYTAFHTILDKYKVIVHRIPHDSTYEDLFDVAASIDGIKMVVNSDISLHEGIEYIPSVVDDEHALALSRHASDAMCLHKNVSKSPGNDQCLHYVGSHDAFVFSGTLDIGHLLKGIFPHYWGSENVVLYELTKVRKVINLCHQIKIYHQHCIAYFSKSKENAPRVNGARSRTISPSRNEDMHILKQSRLNETPWTILVTVNWGFDIMFQNWWYWFSKLKTGMEVVMIAEDSKTYETYKNTSGLIVWKTSKKNLPEQDFSYNSKDYKALVSRRGSYVIRAFEKYSKIIYTDIDTVWLKDPRPYFIGNVDLWGQMDADNLLCTGFIAIKKNEKTHHLVEEWDKSLSSSQGLNQGVFNSLLKTKFKGSYKYLPKKEFPSGVLYFTQGRKEGAVIVHNNWIVGKKAKIDRFKDAGLWLPATPNYKIEQTKSNTNTDSNIGKVIIKNNMGFNRDEPCDIPCHYTTGSGPVDATVYELRGRRAPPSGISVYMQMEGEHYYPIDTTGWTVENTYRWSSPLLKPYFEWIHYHGETDIQSKRVAPDAINGISFLARNCASRNHREQVVKDLMSAGIRVDAMSSCLHNHDKPPEDKGLKWIPNKIKLLRGWKFHAAFENGNVHDYVTEKVYTALAAGTVPIYMGAPNIDEFVPKDSIIRVDSFKDTEALAKHIEECLRNETLYQSYHEWRDRPLNSEFVEKFAFTNVSTECRTCRWVYAHKHSLPWDKKTQTFVKVNTSKSSLITKDIAPLPSLRYVDPFIGTASTGHTTPGAKAPFGMMYMVPVNAYDPMGSKWWEYTAGYQYGDKTFSGIAHTALTGTGIPGLLDIKISPFEDSRNKNNEIAHPGYYSVTVDGVHISVVAGNRFGIHHYAGTSELFLKSKQCSADATKNTIRGSCSAYFNEKWEKKKYPYKVHFYIELPSDCTYQQKKISCSNNNIEMKMAISYVDQDGAKRNFDDENTDWESLYKKTSSDWARSMDKIQVHGWKSEKQRKIFSSALYRTMLSPYTHNDADGRIRGPDGNIHKVDFTYYTFLSTWDTYRAWSAVMRLVRPDVLTDIAKTSVFHYKTMGIMPRWTVAGLDIQMMPGVPSINIAFQAWRWGLTDTKLTKDIYDAIVGTLESKNKYKEGHLDAFVEKGVVPCDGKFQETVSQSLELGLNARCATELASHLHDSKESTWRNLSLAYQRHYDPTYNYLVGVNGANFCKPGSPYKVDANPELYTEGNAITWLWSGPFEGLKSLLGPELFKQRLHELFTKSVGVVSKRDYSGLIGAYAHGNEPTHHVPFWFKQNGDEATTNKYVHQILDTLYLDTPDGLPGNDDAGQISAWYVLATLGIYPVDPLAKEFQTHEPSVQYAVLNEPSGLRHTLTPTTKKEHHVVKYTIPDSLKAYVTTHPEGGLFVKTGDIPEMWIRDSVAQVWPYRDSHSGMIAEVLYRQSEFILHDVYANSYNLKWQVSNKLNHHMQTLGRGEWVGTRNYELDSGCYFMRLLYHAWKKHQLEIKTFRPTVELLVETWQVEQYHEEQSPYRYPELKRNGLGTPVGWTGMTWTGFRPSDDPCTYGYHIPDNLFAAKALEYVSEMFPDIKEAKILRQDILMGVQEYGTWTDNDGKKRYCYEVDGLGGCNKMDDANVPSLLSIPYIDPDGYEHVIWQNTYDWIWSSKNPYFFEGTAAAGIGSPHTPHNYIWPMSLVMRGLVDPTVAEEMREQIEKTKVRGKLHESFHKDDPKRLTREDFSWPNELYKELNI